MLAAGCAMWLAWAGPTALSAAQWTLLAAAALVAALPRSRLWVLRHLRRWRQPAPESRSRIAIRVAVGAAVFFTLVALAAGRDLGLAWHDEHSYAIQLRQLMSGRLWGPGHPLHDFFDSHYIITDRVYASMYFPGTALLHLPGALIGLPYWVTAVCISGITAGLLYRVVSELTDGVYGLVAALLFVSIVQIQHMSVMLMSHVPVIMLGCLLIWAWLRWRGTGRPGWAALIGVVTGWLMITRPADGLCVVLALLVGLVPDLWARRRSGALLAIVAGILGLTPFVVVQGTLNRHVTGSAWTFPHEYYVRRDFPNAQFGFHELRQEDQPRSIVPQKRAFYQLWAAPRIEYHDASRVWEEWRLYRARMTIAAWTAHSVLIVLLPLGVFGLRDRRRAAVAFSIPIFLALYALYCFYIPHYPIVVALAAVAMMVLGLRELPSLYPARRAAIRVFAAVGVAGIAVGSWPFLDARAVYPGIDVSELRRIDETIERLPHKPAVVLFRWSPQVNPHVEPVYNTDVAWPDDAPVIRAHDLGEKNAALIEYYAVRQPERHLYLLDRARRTLSHFGTMADVWEQLQAQRGVGDDGAAP